MGEDEICLKTVRAAKAGDVKIATSDSDVDIRGWATGRVKYPWLGSRRDRRAAQHSVDDKGNRAQSPRRYRLHPRDEIAIR